VTLGPNNIYGIGPKTGIPNVCGMTVPGIYQALIGGSMHLYLLHEKEGLREIM